MSGLRLRGVSRVYTEGDGQRSVVSDLDLDVHGGEMLVLVGPSGCGKSTILRMIAGLDSPSRGTIELENRCLSGVPPQDRDVAMVFQGYALYPHMTAREIMEFPLRMRGSAPKDRARTVEEVAEILDIRHLLSRRPHQLSGGERQRVAMGRAIVRKPKVFLFDEPLSNLDAALRTELRVELSSLIRRLGITSIYVTHDQVEAMTMGDRILVMNKGKRQQLDSPRVIYESPNNLFTAKFLGAPPINAVSLVRKGAFFESLNLRFPAPSGLHVDDVVVAFRPEHLTATPSSHSTSLPDCVSILGKVIGVEPLGAETYVHFDAGGVSLRSRTQGFEDLRLGMERTLSVKVKDLLWFNSKSEERLHL